MHIGGLVQERRNSIANALELRLSCSNPSIYESPVLSVVTHLVLNIHEYSGRTWSISWLLMPWLPVLPDRQRPWYCLLSSIGKVHYKLHHLNHTQYSNVVSTFCVISSVKMYDFRNFHGYCHYLYPAQVNKYVVAISTTRFTDIVESSYLKGALAISKFLWRAHETFVKWAPSLQGPLLPTWLNFDPSMDK